MQGHQEDTEGKKQPKKTPNDDINENEEILHENDVLEVGSQSF